METKCTTELIKRVRPLVESGVTWPTIAAAVGVGESTLRHWRQVGSANYVEKFAEMVRLAVEARDCGDIRAGQVEQAKKHTLKKVTREPKLVDIRSTKRKIPSWAVRKKSKRLLPAPVMPPTSYKKNELILYAKAFLDLEIDGSYTKNEIRIECAKCVDELTVEEMVIIKEEMSEADPNQQAVKNVLTNTGDPAKRWNFKDEHELDVTDKLGKLLTEIGSNRSVLPKQEEIEDYKEEDE